MLNRRAFQKMLLTIGGASAVASFGTLAVAASPLATANSTFRYRLRYQRRGGIFSMWTRVAQLDDLEADVPFTLLLASDQNIQNILFSKSYISRSADSHIVIALYVMGPKQKASGQPIFCKLLLGEQSEPSKIWTCGKT